MIDIGTNNLLDIWLRNRGNEDVDGLCKAVEALSIDNKALSEEIDALKQELADERSGKDLPEEDIFG